MSNQQTGSSGPQLDHVVGLGLKVRIPGLEQPAQLFQRLVPPVGQLDLATSRMGKGLLADLIGEAGFTMQPVPKRAPNQGPSPATISMSGFGP